MKSNIQGRHSVDFRLNNSKRLLNIPRNTTSSQSNRPKVANNAKKKLTFADISKKNKLNIDLQCSCNNSPLVQLFHAVVKLQKQKSLFGSNLEQIQRITKVIKELTSAPVSLCNRLIRVIVSKQITPLFPEVGRLVTQILNLVQQSRGESAINDIISSDIQRLSDELKHLKKQQKQIKRSFEQGTQQQSEKINSLLRTIKLQNLQLLNLKSKHSSQDLQETKQKLSNLRYK